MRNASSFLTVCLLILASAAVADATPARSTQPAAQQVALNPQPLPPIVEHDDWGFDAG